MKFIKKNKFTIIAIIIFLCLVVLGAKVKELLVPDSGKAVYGDRLENIEEHSLSDDLFQTISDKLKADTRVLKVDNKLHGRIINILITVNVDVNVSDAKNIANSIVPMFESGELSYYSLQVYVKKEDASLNNFPIIGYKGIESEVLLFSKDREITITSEEKTNEE